VKAGINDLAEKLNSRQKAAQSAAQLEAEKKHTGDVCVLRSSCPTAFTLFTGLFTALAVAILTVLISVMFGTAKKATKVPSQDLYFL